MDNGDDYGFGEIATNLLVLNKVSILSYIKFIMNIYLSFSFYYFEVHLILVYYVVFILLWFLTEHAPVSLFVLVIEFFFTFLSILK